MYFAQPWFLLLLLLVPLWGGLQWKKRKKTHGVFISTFQDLREAQGSSWKTWIPKIKTLLIIATLILGPITLARPQQVFDKSTVSKNGIDILFVLDVSESMLAEDFVPNRISAAKIYLTEFIDQLTSDRVGILVFAGKPFTQSPLTFDYEALKYYLQDISIASINQHAIGLGGTATGDALLTGVKRFDPNSERTKVMILITDGETNVGMDPLRAAQIARSQKIKIYPIGIGRKGGARIPLGFRPNGEKIYARTPNGQFAVTHLDEETLKGVARIAEGEYFHAEGNKALQENLAKIRELEKSDIETEIVVQASDDFMPWLLALCSVISLFFLLEFLFPMII